MNTTIKISLLLTFLIYTQTAFSAGFGSWATPTRIDVERGNGFMVYGAFGNPNGCTRNGAFYVPASHPQYDKIYSLVLTAFTAGKQIQPYFHKCAPVTWYASTSFTYNYVSSGALNIRNN